MSETLIDGLENWLLSNPPPNAAGATNRKATRVTTPPSHHRLVCTSFSFRAIDLGLSPPGPKTPSGGAAHRAAASRFARKSQGRPAPAQGSVATSAARSERGPQA